MPAYRIPSRARPAAPSIWSRLEAMLTVRRQRLRLRDLDARILRDIGLSAPEAEAEARRPFWDVPDHWRGR